MTRNYPPRSAPPSLAQAPSRPVSKQFQTFCIAKAEIVYDFSLRQKRLSGGGGRQPWCVYLRTKAVGDKTGTWPSPSLRSGSLPKAQGPHSGCRGEILSCVPSSASTNVLIWGRGCGPLCWVPTVGAGPLGCWEQVASVSIGT